MKNVLFHFENIGIPVVLFDSDPPCIPWHSQHPTLVYEQTLEQNSGENAFDAWKKLTSTNSESNDILDRSIEFIDIVPIN